MRGFDACAWLRDGSEEAETKTARLNRSSIRIVFFISLQPHTHTHTHTHTPQSL